MWKDEGKDMYERKTYHSVDPYWFNIGINLYLEAHRKIHEADTFKTLSIKCQIRILKTTLL